MGLKGLLNKVFVKRPPGPSFSEIAEALEKGEAYGTLDYPASLTERFGELIYMPGQYLVTGAVGFEHVLKTLPHHYSKHNLFYTRMKPLFGNSLLLTEGEVWKSHRKIAQPAFQPGMVKNYLPIIIEECLAFCRTYKIKGPSEINLLAAMNLLTLKIALKLFCSQTFSNDSLKKLGKTIHFANWYVSHHFIIKPWRPSLKSFRFYFLMRYMNQFLLTIIRERRKQKNPPQDLLSFLMFSKEEIESHYLTDAEILDEFKTLLLTGHETTACGLTWMWYLLSENPEYLTLLQEELSEVLGEDLPSYEDLNRLPVLKAIVCETFRLYPPIWCLARKTIKPDTLLGYSIPPKSLLILNIYALHRNPIYWEDPNAFYPPRFFEEAPKRHPCAYLPFSVGPRTCIANHFGMVETLLTAAILAQHLRFEKIKKTKAIPEPCISLRPKGGLWMKVVSK